MICLAVLAGGTPAQRVLWHSSGCTETAQAVNSTTSVSDERGLVALDQALREAANPFTVLSIGARPGDEDDGTLAYLRKRLGARVVMLLATHGEGEESATRNEMDEDLGAVRTREAIEAARLIGADLFFLNLRDFGYSKPGDEALRVWGHAEALRRMVRAIRSLRPDVIITNHDEKSGEGIEQTVALVALEAFAAAADTKVAPEAGFEAWDTRRLFLRCGTSAADTSINLDQYDKPRGASCAQIGLAAHQRFISRGSNLDRMTPDRSTSNYRLAKSAASDLFKRGDGLFDGLRIPENVRRSIEPPRVGDSSLVDAIAAGDRLVEALQEKLIEKRAEGSADTMHERYGAEFVRVVRFTSAIERALVLALGLRFEITLSDNVVVPGQKLVARLTFRNGSGRTFPIVFSTPDRLLAPDRHLNYKTTDTIGVGANGLASLEFEYDVAKDAELTLPHSAQLYDEEYFPVGSSLPGAHPAEAFGARLLCSADVGLGQVSIRLAALARFDVAAPAEISTIPFALLKDWSTPREIEFPVRVRNRTPGPMAGALWVVPLALADDDYDPVHVSFAREDDQITITLKLRLPILKPPLAPDVLLEFRRQKPASTEPLASAKIDVRAIDLDSPRDLNVGYISGHGDWLSIPLAELGVQHSAIPVERLSLTEHGNAARINQSLVGCGDLARFDTIIIDEDAYFANPELMPSNRCLLRYTRQGGNLIVLSQQPRDWNFILSGSQLAPHSIELSADRIAYEGSRIKILDAEQFVMTSPNKISSKDFEGWVVERARNIPRRWATEYKALLETSDPGEDSNQGVLLFARYGEGTYVITSLAWRRQLIAGNPGAYRLFANLVSVRKMKAATPR